jgi:sulfur dioxygenase
MIFRQLFEPLSSTYTYLLGCQETGKAILIDPVISAMERDLAEISRLGLELAYTFDTHSHADHVTAALELKKKVARLRGRHSIIFLVPTLLLKKTSRFK